MNTKALLATLVVIGSSTAALADGDHRAVDGQRTIDAPRDIDGQWMRGHRRLPEWTLLSAQDSLRTGRDTVKPAQAPAYKELKLEATSGKVEIDRVVIKFGNGSTQTLTPHAVLAKGSPSLTLDLAGNERHIAKISVFGKGSWRSRYQILAV